MPGSPRWPLRCSGRVNSYHLRFEIDTFFAAVGKVWGSTGDHRREGFRYVVVSDDSEPVTSIVRGPVGEQIMAGARAAVAAAAWQGNGVIIDDLPANDEDAAAWGQALEGLRALVVRVDVSDSVAAIRERHRNHPAGLARGHAGFVETFPADLRVDSSSRSTDDLADEVVRWLATEPVPAALKLGSPGSGTRDGASPSHVLDQP